jgi:hypothetical protein
VTFSNSFGELETVSTVHGAATLYGVTCTRDLLGRIDSKTETVEGVTTTTVYGRDLDGRLETVTENGVLARTYAYDGNGNRLSLTEGGSTTSGSYSPWMGCRALVGATLPHSCGRQDRFGDARACCDTGAPCLG